MPNYSIVSSEPFKVIIRDNGPWDRYPTITNNCEEVIEDMLLRGWIKEGQQLLYYDSEGQLDELKLEWNPAGDNVRFAGFAPGPR